MSRGLLDTSVFIAREQRQPLGRLPDKLAALIAATAVEHGLPVVTQDEDFAAMSRAHPRLVVERV